ncbi:MAG: NADH-quinone oxidoreductase subunit L [Firmicutes bacterium]|nr:NADH-quinone oxidoreductase subunit L [Bacillota bacterium]
MLLFGWRLPKVWVSGLCVGSVLVSFVYSVGAFLQLRAWPFAALGYWPEKVLFDWVPLGAYHTDAGQLAQFTAEWGFLLDPLSAVMILVVTGVGLLIHIYSIGYMGHEGGYYRFFGYMNLFMFSMLTLVLANNLLLMFVGWEGVGLCSYLLIGFYFLRKSAADAGKKAFLVNRVGDAGFLLGIFLTAATLGTIKFAELGPAIQQMGLPVGAPVLTAIGLLLFVGATGKSAQIPLYVWLPDAMEGPTPVSALIHAATMVTAGVYMVTRTNALYQMAPEALTVVAIVGALTAFYAATIGLVQTDIKRVLAYSTISQLGYMFLACGVGAFAAGIFHLMTHAFFKALLFLAAGSVIHALSGEQDLRKMGALWNRVPVTARTMFIAALAIAGIPPLAGFFSKDEILWKTWSSGGIGRILWLVGAVTALLTAFYMFRLVNLTFFGKSRVPKEVEHHVHESPAVMTAPLMILAVLSVIGGWVGIPAALGGSHHFEHWLEPVIARPGLGEVTGAQAEAHHDPTEYVLMGLSVLLALAGIALARFIYLRREGLAEQLAARWGRWYRLLYHKYYVDELYDALFVHRTKDLGTTLGAFDRSVIDGWGVDGSAWVTRLGSRLSIWWDTWIVDGLVNLTAWVVGFFSYPFRWLQTGRVQNYALVFALGVLILLAYYLRGIL